MNNAAPQFDFFARNGFQNETKTIILAAGVEVFINLTGNYFYVVSGVDCVYRFAGAGNVFSAGVTLSAGKGVKTDGTAFLRLSLKSATAQTVTVLGIIGEYIDNLLTFATNANLPVVPAKTTLVEDPIAANGLTSVVQDTVVLISAANTAFVQRCIRNDHATISVYIRSDATKAKSAWKLGPGEKIIISSQNALYCWNVAASGATVDVYVTDETIT